MRSAVAILMLIASLAAAHAFGLGKEGLVFGKLGSLGKPKAAPAVATCNGTGLIFNVACNSQYIGIL